MSPSRRRFLHSATLAGLASPFLRFTSPPPKLLKPPRLRPGQTVGLVCPATAAFLQEEVEIAKESIEALGLKVREGKSLRSRYGYLAGTDEERAADLHAMFADPEVHAVFVMHGGWGCSRLLPLLDYDLIRRHPKILMGYSDVTALLLGIQARTGLVTFHGPVGASTWNAFSVDYLRRLLFDGEAVIYQNPTDKGDNLTQVENRIRTLRPGKVRGRLLGGNLTVLTAIVGSPYLPDWKDAILFVEDVGEKIYRIDRMLTQLALADILPRLKGFVFGHCSDCPPGEGYASFTLEEVLDDHIVPLQIPAFSGSMIGHIKDKFTVPLGVEAEIDAATGSIRLLEGAVS